jgi:Protein of unknown function (DUF2894)
MKATPLAPPWDCSQQLASLHERGAAQREPLRWHYLALLAQRALTQRGAVKTILQTKLALALADFEARLQAAPAPAPAPAQQLVAPALRKPGLTLGDLARQLAHAGTDAAGDDGALGVRPELRAVRQYRNTWAQLSANQQLAQALQQAPQNAGPINSHRLVLQSLALMRSISPDYLSRFMAYADTLLCLDQGDAAKPALGKAGAAGTHAKKPTARRSGAR